ncbi:MULTISPECIES: hypothetical protein [Methylobacterium]|jgi:hypothetical protein|uniref:Uncharacterized protein n=3 Tax=Methylobacterium TaxID=407 RepID=A0AAE8HPH2_9HYPH|nr:MULTISPECIES: hypothetical protein [Methylobacterium]KOX50240.1 hypothetical protein ADL19_19460 [Streptomyces purpurogeneiscleroticus]AIQ89433.1 protein of unassigned function [Methylobacterium oryzae CBMB20]APT30267.1 hypothetical protein MCBMB27_00976 [Methylobacterium phyllosphaerae]AWV18235.1 hypothetical protein A3862_24220 [Methylobacterium sp. XJLW]MBA9065423.1 RNA polymerase-interacting CarD/CdnL/TRCF family regulator [Methylobacterium fujisawaense]
MSTSADPPNARAEKAALRKATLRAHIKNVLSTIRSHHTGRGRASMRVSRYTLGRWFRGIAAGANPLFA